MADGATSYRSKPMKRAWLTANSVVNGPEILAFIAKPETRALLVAEAKRGLPPVRAISGELFDRFGEDVRQPTLKQAIGTIVRGVLYDEGFRVAEKGVRLRKDPIFRTASIYEHVGDPQRAKPADLVGAMFGNLTEQQAMRVATILENSHPGVLRKAAACMTEQ